MTVDHPFALRRLAERARRAATALHEEHAAGRRGDQRPAAPIWATPSEQLDAVMRMLRTAGRSSRATATRPPSGPANDPAASMTEAMRSIDWAKVRAATADRSGNVARAARRMAEQVDWATLQPRAAQVSRSVIAAVAAGQLGVGGRLGAAIARTIVDHDGLAGQIGSRLDRQSGPPDDAGRSFIDTTATESGTTTATETAPAGD